MSLAALPPDPALPELRVAGDPERMREVFQRHLRPLHDGALHLVDCRLTRVHYHRGARCALRYTLRLGERDAGRERSQWVTGLLYPGERAARVWAKLERSDPGRRLPEVFPDFEPVSFLPELKMIVQVFPYDRHLPALPRLALSPPPDLEPLFLAAFGTGDWRTASCRVAPSQYRVGRAAVLRYDVAAETGSASARKRFYAKVYRREDDAARAYGVLRSLWEAPVMGVAVPKPAGYLPELATLVQEDVGGTSLHELLLQGPAEPAARQAAEAMSAFQRGAAAGLPHRRREDEVEVLQWAGRVLGWACPHLAGRVERVVGTVAARLDDVRPARTHGELKTGHVLLDRDGAGVVDLDSCAASDPLLDPARILAELAGLRLRHGSKSDARWTGAANAFAEEYLRGAHRDWPARLVPHYAGALLKEAVDVFRHLEAGWPEKVPALVGEAEAALSRREW